MPGLLRGAGRLCPLYARAKPSGDIRVQVTLLGNAGGAAVAGPVAGSGVRVDETLEYCKRRRRTLTATGVRIKLLGDGAWHRCKRHQLCFGL